MQNDIRQETYLTLVRNNVPFSIKGHSISTWSETFPIQMAKKLGVKPTNFMNSDHEEEFNKRWNNEK